jgi:hypothetical protein
VRFTKGLSHQEALKQVKAGGGSYASVLQQRMDKAREDIPDPKDDIIRTLTETITKLSNRIEELEKRKSRKEHKKNKQHKSGNQEKQTDQEEDQVDEEMETDVEAELATNTPAGTINPTPNGSRSGAPRPDTANLKVSGSPISSNASPISFKRQHTTTEFSLPTKKTADHNNPSNQSNNKAPLTGTIRKIIQHSNTNKKH